MHKTIATRVCFLPFILLSGACIVCGIPGSVFVIWATRESDVDGAGAVVH